MSAWSYENQVILGPMVRVGTLPMRIHAQRYGATMVYGEEIIDRKIIETKRTESDTTVDYIMSNGFSCFTTLKNRQEPVVFQMGTADAFHALKAAEHVAQDVRAIDINMGCPKHFSISGGMGAALLHKPETIEDILKTLKRNLTIPVTCKIRLLQTTQATLDLVRCIDHCHVDALAVHARQIPDRPRYQADIDAIRMIVAAASIPIIHNADVFHNTDIPRIKEQTGATSIMICRGAMWNPTIFSDKPMLPVYDVMREFTSIAEEYNNYVPNTRFTLIEMMKGHGKGKMRAAATTGGQMLHRAKTYPQLQEALDLLDKVPVLHEPYKAQTTLLPRTETHITLSPPNRKRKVED